MEAGDGRAYHFLDFQYFSGDLGLLQNQEKELELWAQEENWGIWMRILM